MMGEGMDASKDIYTPSPVITYDTEEQCHDRLRLLHKEIEGSSLKWEKKNPTITNDILLLLSKDKSGIWKCAETSTTMFN